jgi:gamma-glutamylcyclotransferase (GGCT)/AIG2-like uncharacterized protein YtfP
MNDPDLLPLFTFGTLRRGEANHHYLDGNYDNWLPATLREFKRGITSHGFATVLPSAGARVAGELFFLRPDVYAETMRRCDLLEDIVPGTLRGCYYRRAKVVVQTASGDFPAWAYIDHTVPE